MGFLICAAALLFIIFGFAFYSYNFSLDPKNAKIARSMLVIMGILGAAAMCLSAVLFFVILSRVKADGAEKDVIFDSFLLFAAVEAVLVGAGLLITLASSLMKSFLRPVIPVFLPMWGIVTLFWAWIYCVWSEFDAFDTTALVILFGAGGAFLLAFSAIPQMSWRIKILTDEKSRGELIVRIRAKRAKKERKRNERKRLREQKKRLKHPKRK